MDSFELNKIAGAVLFALLVGFGLSIFSDILFETEVPETPGYIIAVAETEGGGEAAEAEAGPQPIAALLASADPAAGESSFKKCAACHTAEEGGANKVGPNLWNIVNRPIAAHPGFAYSDAMIAFSNNQQEVWDYDHLSNFLHDPKGTVPGTKMAFAGLKQDAERANVIAYLRSLSASPAPLPEPPAPEAAAAAEGEAAPAAAEQPAGGAEAPGSSEQPQAAPEGQANPQEQASPAAGGAGPAAQAGAPVNPLSNVPAEQQGGVTQPEAPSGATPTGPTEGAVPPTAAPAEGAAPAPAAPAPAPAEPAPAAPAAPAPEQQGAAPQAAPAGAQAAVAGGSPFAQLVAQADPAAGEAAARKCIACHTFEEGGANKVGPRLFGVVGRPIAALEDFNYSDAMREFSEGGAKAWDVDTLGAYLENPRGVVPGTKMVFAGLKREDERASVVSYLTTLGGTAGAAPQQ